MDLYSNEAQSDSEKNENEVISDANNNGLNSQEKYSLRPRSLRQKTQKGLELKKEDFGQKNKKKPENGKVKQKPPPLSKYRRKTANARERNRMREINLAFETLRRAVPHISGSLNSGSEKLTKITTLRLAMKYIQALRQVLDSTCDNHQNISHQISLASFIDDDADLEVFLSDGESLPLNSDLSEPFASPDHPFASPFSNSSYCENSPDISNDSPCLFDENFIASDFTFSVNLTDTHFSDNIMSGNRCDELK